MKHRRITELFGSRKEARDYLSNNPCLLIEGSKLFQTQFKVVKGKVDILLKREDVLFLVEIKDKGSLYSARQQISRYGRMFERFSPIFQGKKLEYVIVKLQKYLGTDVYTYEDIDDVLSRKNDYETIHLKRTLETQNLPEIKEKTRIASDSPETKRKWKKNWKVGMVKHAKKMEDSKYGKK